MKKGSMGRFGNEIRGWERPKLFPLKFRYSDDVETIGEFKILARFVDIEKVSLIYAMYGYC